MTQKALSMPADIKHVRLSDLGGSYVSKSWTSRVPYLGSIRGTAGTGLTPHRFRPRNLTTIRIQITVPQFWIASVVMKRFPFRNRIFKDSGRRVGEAVLRIKSGPATNSIVTCDRAAVTFTACKSCEPAFVSLDLGEVTFRPSGKPLGTSVSRSLDNRVAPRFLHA